MRTFDLGAFILCAIYGGVLVFLISFLFNIKNIFGNSKVLRYLAGHPEYKDIELLEGIIEVRDERVDFKEPEGSKIYFSIPIDRIKDVSAGSENSGYQESIFNKFFNILSEDQLLCIKLRHENSEHTLQFSAHKASSVNDDIKKEILDAKSRTNQKNASARA